MKKTLFFLSIALLILLTVLLFPNLQKLIQRLTTPQPLSQTSPLVEIDIFVTPPELKSFDFQIQELGSTISVSWATSDIEIFHLVLMDVNKFKQQPQEDPIILVINSEQKPPEDPKTLPQKEDIQVFLTPPYTIGEKKEGFFSSEAEGVILEKGKEYYLQLVGFDREGNFRVTTKKFKFGQ